MIFAPRRVFFPGVHRILSVLGGSRRGLAFRVGRPPISWPMCAAVASVSFRSDRLGPAVDANPSAGHIGKSCSAGVLSSTVRRLRRLQVTDAEEKNYKCVFQGNRYG